MPIQYEDATYIFFRSLPQEDRLKALFYLVEMLCTHEQHEQFITDLLKCNLSVQALHNIKKTCVKLLNEREEGRVAQNLYHNYLECLNLDEEEISSAEAERLYKLAMIEAKKKLGIKDTVSV